MADTHTMCTQVCRRMCVCVRDIINYAPVRQVVTCFIDSVIMKRFPVVFYFTVYITEVKCVTELLIMYFYVFSS